MSYGRLEQDLKGDNTFAQAVFLFTIAVCLLTVIIFIRCIQSQRREIGVLMALGFAPTRILISFLIISIAPGTLVGTIGVLLSVPSCWLLADSVAYFLIMPAAIAFLPIAALPGIRHIATTNISVPVRRESFGQ